MKTKLKFDPAIIKNFFSDHWEKFVVAGSIDRPKDVDVFAFAGKRGQKLRVETQAFRFGSALDPQLTLYRAGSLQVDVLTKSLAGDRFFEVELPFDDQYFIVVNDANDTGSAIHVYRLIVDLN